MKFHISSLNQDLFTMQEIWRDHGSRYMSKIFSDKWMKEQGFDQKNIEQESSIEHIR